MLNPRITKKQDHGVETKKDVWAIYRHEEKWYYQMIEAASYRPER